MSVDKLFIEDSISRGAILTDRIRFIDLFCGIGGFRFAANNSFKKLGIKGKCVFSSDIDLPAQESYEANFGERPTGDITKVAAVISGL